MSKINRPDLVLVHGWAFGAAVFTPLATRLREVANIHFVELPGYGSNFDCEASSAELADWLYNNTPADAMWLGWSMGAMLSVTVALKFPEHIEKLILVGGTPKFANGEDWSKGVDQVVLDQFKREIPHNTERLLRRFTQLVLSPDNQPEACRSLSRLVTAGGGVSTVALLRDIKLLAEMDLRRQLSSLNVPTTLVHGCADNVTPVAASKVFSDLCNRSVLKLLPNLGHGMFFTHPDLFSELVTAELGI